MIFIDRNLFNAPAYFNSPEIIRAKKKLDEFYESSARKSSRLRIQFHEKIVYDHLQKAFSGKCAFCESPAMQNGDIEHFRHGQAPKDFRIIQKNIMDGSRMSGKIYTWCAKIATVTKVSGFQWKGNA